MDKERATTMVVMRKRLMCPDCGHRHREDQYCHVYVEAADDVDINEMGSDNDDEEKEDSDDDIGFSKIKSKAKRVVEEEEIKPLVTPVILQRLLILLCVRL